MRIERWARTVSQAGRVSREYLARARLVLSRPMIERSENPIE